MKREKFKNIFKIMFIGIIAAATLVTSSIYANNVGKTADSNQEYIYISDIDYISGKTEYASITRDTNPGGGIISLLIEGKEKNFIKGMGAHATSTIVYDISKYNYDKFTAYLGVDASVKGSTNTDGVKFTISVSNDNVNWTEKYKSDKPYKAAMDAVYVSVDVKGYKYLRLYCDKIGTNYSDNAVYANAKLSTKDYKENNENVPFIKTVAEYDALIKGYSISEDVSAYEHTLLKRTFVNNVGYDILQSLCQYSEKYSEAIKWLMEDMDNLKLYLTGGNPEANNYSESIKILCKLYEKHKDDLSITTKSNVSGVTLGEVYKKMMITLSLTHSKKVYFWEDHSQLSDPIVRYEVFKDLHEKDLLDNKIFDNLNIINMRWVFNSLISDDQIAWLNNHVRKNKGIKDPYYYIKYTGGYNYLKPIYYSQENYEKWDKKYELSKYNVGYSDKHPKLWMIFEEGSVCGGLSKTGTNINTSSGVPALVIGQPGHAAYLFYSVTDKGLGQWSIGNDISYWQESNWTDEGTMGTGWGVGSWVSGFQVSYVLLSQAALNDFSNYEKAEELIYLSKVYEKDNAKLQTIYNLAIKTQPLNLDAWLGLINAYKADSTKTTSDYMELAKKIASTFTYHPLPMWDLLRLIEGKITINDANTVELTLLRQDTLKKASKATDANTLQPAPAKSLANYLLGKNDLTIATFSFDGENASKIVLAPKFDESGTRLKYSLDGGKVWQETSEKQVKLTDEQLESITPENGILVGLVGCNSNQKIDISQLNKPNNLYNNDLENTVINATDAMEWSIDGKKWTSYKQSKPSLLGDISVMVRMSGKGNSKFSESVTLSYKQDSIDDTKKYIPISHLSIHDVSSAQPGADAKHVIDGNINTMWHNLWDGSDKKRYIVIKLDKEKYISALQYIPRQSGNNGTIKNGRILTSIDGKNFEEAAKMSNLAYNATAKTISFDKPVLAQYVKIEATESFGGFMSSSMINLFEDSTITIKSTLDHKSGVFDLYTKSDNHKQLNFKVIKNDEKIKTIKINNDVYDLDNNEHMEKLATMIKTTDDSENLNIEILFSWLKTLKKGNNKISILTNNNNVLTYDLEVVDTLVLTEKFKDKNSLGSIVLQDKMDSNISLKIEKTNTDDTSLSIYKDYIKNKELIGKYDVSIYEDNSKINYDKKTIITINVGIKYNNKKVKILHYKNGNMEEYTSTVKDGVITFTSETGLSEFLLFVDEVINVDKPAISDDEQDNKIPPKDPNLGLKDDEKEPSKKDDSETDEKIEKKTNVNYSLIIGSVILISGIIGTIAIFYYRKNIKLKSK